MRWWWLGVGACVTVMPPDPGDLVWDTRTAADVGDVCLWAGTEASSPFTYAQEFEPGEPVRAVATGCLGGCERNGVLTLAVESSSIDGSLVLTSRLDWEQVRPVEGLACHNACSSVDAVLELPPFERGSHEIRFGDQVLDVVVPGLQWACFERVLVPR